MATRNKNEKGFALILALIVASVALAIGLSMLEVTVKQLTLSTSAKESEVAFQAAVAGINCLEYARDKHAATILVGNTVNVNCFGSTVSMNDMGTGNTHVYRDLTSGVNWSAGSSQVCIRYEMQVLDTITEGGPLSGPGSKTCPSGDVCTFLVARGYNRQCSDIGTGGMVFMRELTAEF